VALKPTIYKFGISLADIDRNHYEDLQLTVARHPSETGERMLARVLAYCLNNSEGLSFASGLSTADEPDLWRHSPDGQILDWIQVGEPSAERIRKAARLAERVVVYSFNTKADLWWRQTAPSLERLTLEVFQYSWQSLQTLAGLIDRTTDISVTISLPSVFVATPQGEVDLSCIRLDQST
jgi:uncharacterized protein YaeQ